MSLWSSYIPGTMFKWVIRFWEIGRCQFHINEILPFLTWIIIFMFYSTFPFRTIFAKVDNNILILESKQIFLHTYCIKSYNCSSMAMVLNEQQKPSSVGRTWNRSEHRCFLPYQWHSRNIPNPSLSQDCITYNIPNYVEKLSMYVKNIFMFTCLRTSGNSFL